MRRGRRRGARRRRGDARRPPGLHGRASGRTPVPPLDVAPSQPPPGGTAGPDEEVEALQARARALADRLRAIQARIGSVGHETGNVAVADPEHCVGCGVCHDVCPTGAIAVHDIARVDRATCTGCGRCVAECPRGALRPQGDDPVPCPPMERAGRLIALPASHFISRPV